MLFSRIPSPTSVPVRTPGWKLGIAAAILLLMLFAAVGRVLQLGYRDTLQQEITNLRNLSTAFAAQTLAATRAIDQILIEVQHDYARALPNPAIRPDYLNSGSPAQAYLAAIYVIDKDGQVIARSDAVRAATAGQASLPAALASVIGNPGGLKVAVTDVDEQSGHAMLNFIRPLTDARGNPAGSVIAQVDSGYFQRIYDSVLLGKGGSVTLLTRDGTMLVRGPSLPHLIGHSFWSTPLFQKYLPQSAHGVIQAVSPIDGVERVYGYDATDDYPLVVIAGLDRDVALASWYDRMHAAIFFVGLITAAVVFLALRVSRDAAQQAALIAKLTASENRIAMSAQYLRATLNTLATPVWVLNARRRLILLNDAFARFAGQSSDELLGQAEAEVLGADGASEREVLYGRALQGERAVSRETEIRDGSGKLHTFIQLTSNLVDQDGSTQLVSVLTDISERKEAEKRLAYLADFDLLTELPNQTQFRRLLREEILSAAGKGAHLAILLISAERLQEIIDLAGHEASDDALRQAAHLLRRFSERACCIARVKSNEFAVLVAYDGAMHSVKQLADELHAHLSEPVSIAGRDYYFGPVIGIALFPQDGTDADELLRRADIAKHRARLDNLEPIHFVFDSAHALLDEQLSIEAQLRRALERNEFRLAYQPKVDIASGRIAGFEALLRWNSARLGEVPPSRFVPVAERTGLIVPIGAWVMREACREIQGWTSRLGKPVRVAVNLSLRQFHQKDLIPMMRRCLDDSGLRPGCLELEITESTAMSHAEEVDRLLHEIRAIGATLSIDDFGTGYSSLAYLKRFPVQALKIDRAFVHDLGRDDDSAAIIRSIIGLGRSLKLRIVAEGVETEEQLEFLRGLSCDEYQGYLSSRPLDAAAAFQFLEENWSRHPRIEEADG
jgi:diguanylate cyclase (GGDEF)-like protein/PAS domain S-box-containing protein